MLTTCRCLLLGHLQTLGRKMVPESVEEVCWICFSGLSMNEASGRFQHFLICDVWWSLCSVPRVAFDRQSCWKWFGNNALGFPVQGLMASLKVTGCVQIVEIPTLHFVPLAICVNVVLPSPLSRWILPFQWLDFVHYFDHLTLACMLPYQKMHNGKFSIAWSPPNIALYHVWNS
jgi:hypothetical protein